MKMMTISMRDDHDYFHQDGLDIIEVPLPTNRYSDIFAAIAPHLDMSSGPWVGGGVLRRILMDDLTTPHDFDIFYQRVDHMGIVSGVIPKTRIFEGNPVQMTFRDVTSYIGLLNDFDFTVTQFVSDGRVIRGTRQAFADIQTKTLRLICPDVKSHMRRLLRYMGQGFVALPDTLDHVLTTFNPTKFYSVHDETLDEYFYDAVGKSVIGDVDIINVLSDIQFDVMNDRTYIQGRPFTLVAGFMYCLYRELRHSIEKKHEPLWNRLELSEPQIGVIDPVKLAQLYRSQFAGNLDNLTAI